MNQIVDGLPNPNDLPKPYPSRKEDKCITLVDYLIDGQKATSKFNGRLREDELRAFSESVWYLRGIKSCIVTGMRFYTMTTKKQVNIIVK